MGKARARGRTAARSRTGRTPLVAERMAAAARTASALSHQFANYLGSMGAMIELLAERVRDDPDARQDLEVLAHSVAGATQFLALLRDFTHPRPLGEGGGELSAAVRDAEPALRAMLRATPLALRLAAAPLPVRAEPAPLARLTLDLVAAVAPDGAGAGDVTIVTRRGPGRGRAILVVKSRGRRLGAALTGCVFEPFAFDPSPDGGLRLAAAYAALTHAGGSITVTAEGDAVVARVALPLAAARRPGTSRR